jgi:hypothetical protein
VAHQTSFPASDRKYAFALFLTPYIIELIALALVAMVVAS